MHDLARRGADLYQQHQQLAGQLLQLTAVAVRDHSYAANRATILELLDALAGISAALLPLQVQLRAQAAERLVEHSALVAQQAAERRRRKREAEQALQLRREQEWARSPLRVG